MKPALVLAALTALLFVISARADIVYTLSVVDAPGGIGDFSWSLDTPDFIVTPPPMKFDSQENCIANCNPGIYDSFTSTSAPSNGDGCAIPKVWLEPDYAPVTFFAPLCDGLYDAFSGGAFPEPGPSSLGTASWEWQNYDGTDTIETLTVTDPPVSTPESSTWKLLLCGMGLAWIVSKVKL